MESNHFKDQQVVEAGKIFVGGLSWQTTNEGLQAYFASFGEVTDSVIMTDNVSKKPRGFGFVTFADPRSVETVLKRGPHIIDNKTVDPKHAQQKGSTEQPPSTTTGTKKIFVGGLQADTTVDQVRAHFSQYGNVGDVDLKVDKETNRMRGFGFVGFDSEEIVEKVVGIHFHQINGKTVEAKKAQPRNTTAAANTTNPHGMTYPEYAGYGQHPQHAQQAAAYAYPYSLQQQQQQQQQQSQQQYTGYGTQYAAAMFGAQQARYAGQAAAMQNQSYSQDASAYAGYNPEAAAYGGQTGYGYDSHTYGDVHQPQQQNAVTSYSMGQRQQSQQQQQQQQRGGGGHF